MLATRRLLDSSPARRNFGSVATRRQVDSLQRLRGRAQCTLVMSTIQVREKSSRRCTTRIGVDRPSGGFLVEIYCQRGDAGSRWWAPGAPSSSTKMMKLGGATTPREKAVICGGAGHALMVSSVPMIGFMRAQGPLVCELGTSRAKSGITFGTRPRIDSIGSPTTRHTFFVKAVRTGSARTGGGDVFGNA